MSIVRPASDCYVVSINARCRRRDKHDHHHTCHLASNWNHVRLEYRFDTASSVNRRDGRLRNRATARHRTDAAAPTLCNSCVRIQAQATRRNVEVSYANAARESIWHATATGRLGLPKRRSVRPELRRRCYRVARGGLNVENQQGTALTAVAKRNRTARRGKDAQIWRRFGPPARSRTKRTLRNGIRNDRQRLAVDGVRA